MKSRFTGIWPALVTPFHNGEIHHAALRGLVHRFNNAGVSGLVVCGTSGEAASMSPEERLLVLETVIECGSGLPLIMGLAGNNLADVLAELKIVQSRPIAGVLIPPPYYVRPSQQGITAFYDAIVQATSVPLILYNIPYRTGVPMELGTIRELARHPAVCAIKDCGGDAALTMQLIADGQLDVLAGEDLQIFSTLCLGGSGAISAAANVRPDLFVHMATAIQAGELCVARQLFYALRPTIGELFSEPNPAPVKAALAELGLIDNELRAPMVKASPSLAASISRHLNRLEEMEQG
jgi:4-hydroxy-tetrahydrodipicolinate synthase